MKIVKRILLRLLILILVAILGLGWFFRGRISTWWQQVGQPVLVKGGRPLEPNPERYQVLKEEVERWRIDLGKRYRAAGSTGAKQDVLDEAAVFLEAALPDLMSCWLGTPWDFNGTSETPGEGKIACGYFVSTVLRDAGFKVDRYALARQPSQNIIRTFLPRKDMSLRVGKTYEAYAAELRSMGAGVRIVGLDNHVGFIVSGKDSFRFVHSSGSKPWCVVDEAEDVAEVLRRSNYRVQGNLTKNEALVRSWILGEKFKVAGQ